MDLQRPGLALLLTLAAGCGDALNPYATSSPTRVPTISFDSVKQSGDITTILVSFQKVLVADTWNLRFASTSTTTLGGAIGLDLTVTSRKIEWNTAETPSGTYYLYGELASLGGVYTASAPVPVTVRGGVVAGNTAPTASLSYPQGGERLVRGSTVEVPYTAADADGDSPTVRIELSNDSGNSWTTLADGVSGSPYAWVVPADQAVGLSYKIRVVAIDAAGAVGAAASRRAFSIE